MSFLKYNTLANNILNGLSDVPHSLREFENQIETTLVIESGKNFWDYYYNGNAFVLHNNPVWSKRGKIWHLVERNPSKAYRIYKFLTDDVLASMDNIDVYIPPYSIKYDISIDPKLEATRKFVAHGLLDSVKWEITDGNGNALEEILKVWTEYHFKGQFPVLDSTVLGFDVSGTYLDGLEWRAADTFDFRYTFRQWIKEDGSYSSIPYGQINSDIIRRRKPYSKDSDGVSENEAGERTRKNIHTIAGRKYVAALGLFVTGEQSIVLSGGLPPLAVKIGLSFEGKYSNELSSFKSSGNFTLAPLIYNESNISFSLDTIIDPDLVPAAAVVLPEGLNMTIREFLIKKYAGII